VLKSECAFIPAEGRWEVYFMDMWRDGLAALAAFLYATLVVAEPAHRLPK
jgi:hypothetical protein